MELADHVVVVTGAGSGMGAATAHRLAQAGARVALLDRHAEAVAQVAAEMGGLALTCDVTSEVSAQQALDTVLMRFQKITGLVNCAGIAPASRVLPREGVHSLALFEQVIQVNLIGTFQMMRLCAAQMAKQAPQHADGERGVIINTASVAAFEGQIGQVAYSASKGGVVAMTLPVARELAQFGIRVMTIAPGVMETPMLTAMPEAVQASLGESVPWPKRLGRAEEYARLVQHIFENTYLNGSVIRLDGALRMAPK